MVSEAVSSVTTDESFQIPSPYASAAVSTATRLNIYITDILNMKVVEEFSSTLFDMLKGCIDTKVCKRSEYQRQKMWSKYHQLRTSHIYCKLWEKFIAEGAGHPVSPIFYQHVGNQLFRMLIKEYYYISTEDSTMIVAPPSNEEMNALRFVAGSVCHRVRNKITRNHHPLKSSLLIAIRDMAEDDSEVPLTPEEECASTEWMKAINRGGLFRVNDLTFTFFQCIEMLIRGTFHENNVENINHETKEKITKIILLDEETSFYWGRIMEEVGQEESKVLLGLVVELYITIRGHSFAKTWMEKYKQINREMTQKSKALRKTVGTTSAKH
jgi:hypothetical protein